MSSRQLKTHLKVGSTIVDIDLLAERNVHKTKFTMKIFHYLTSRLVCLLIQRGDARIVQIWTLVSYHNTRELDQNIFTPPHRVLPNTNLTLGLILRNYLILFLSTRETE